MRYHYAARLAILAGAGLTLLIYIAFPQGGVVPWSSNRYLTPLQIATPTVFAPLWQATYAYKTARSLLAPLVVFLKFGILLFASASLTIGAVKTFGYIPGAQAGELQEQALIHNLLDHNITHIYSDYWTCDRIIFESAEYFPNRGYAKLARDAFERSTGKQALNQGYRSGSLIKKADAARALGDMGAFMTYLTDGFHIGIEIDSIR